MEGNGTETLNFEDLTKAFDEQLEEFKKTYGGSEEVEESSEVKLEKAKGRKKAPDFEEDDDGEDEEEEEVDDKEAKGVKKSIDDFLAEDPEAEAAMDVSPFLAQLTKAVKAIEERVDGLQKSISDKMVGVETMLKAQGKATYLQMELQKSQRTTVELIAKEDREVGGMLRMRKSRFDGEGAVNIDGPTVLEKSREWVAEKKIDILEAGLIEQRVNKNSLGTYKDDLDSKVERLIKEAS